MTAEEMFKKLGYNKIEHNSEIIEYSRLTPNGNIEYITFNLKGEYKSFGCFLNNNFSWCYFNEIPAINKQIEELGWNNETTV